MDSSDWQILRILTNNGFFYSINSVLILKGFKQNLNYLEISYHLS